MNNLASLENNRQVRGVVVNPLKALNSPPEFGIIIFLLAQIYNKEIVPMVLMEEPAHLRQLIPVCRGESFCRDAHSYNSRRYVGKV